MMPKKMSAYFIRTGAVFLAMLSVLALLTYIGLKYPKAALTGTRVAHSLPIFSVETAEKKVAITFDAAWAGDEIPKLIDILSKADVHATFFAVGDWVRENPKQVKALSAKGHEIANHSDRHPHVLSQNAQEIQADLLACDKAIKQLGISPAPYYRGPYGEFNDTVVLAAKELGFTTVQWSVDSLDWKGLSEDKILERTTKSTKAGDILLFHTGKENTLSALPKVLSALKAKGLTPCTVSELLLKGPYTIDITGRQQPLET